MLSLKDKALQFGIHLAIKKRGLKWVVEEYARMGDKYDVEGGKKFKNAEEEVADMIRIAPMLKPAENNLVQLIRNCRVVKGLPA